MSAKRLTVAERKAIFHALVTTQDSGLLSVAESVRQVGFPAELAVQLEARQIAALEIDEDALAVGGR